MAHYIHWYVYLCCYIYWISFVHGVHICSVCIILSGHIGAETIQIREQYRGDKKMNKKQWYATSISLYIFAALSIGFLYVWTQNCNTAPDALQLYAQMRYTEFSILMWIFLAGASVSGWCGRCYKKEEMINNE